MSKWLECNVGCKALVKAPPEKILYEEYGGCDTMSLQPAERTLRLLLQAECAHQKQVHLTDSDKLSSVCTSWLAESLMSTTQPTSYLINSPLPHLGRLQG